MSQDTYIEPIPARPPGEPYALTHLLYALHTLTWFSGGIFSVIAMVINYINRATLPNEFYRSHWRWQARSFWFTLLGFVATSPLWLLFLVPGWIAWGVVGLWYLYRCIRGWVNFADRRMMPVQSPVQA